MAVVNYMYQSQDLLDRHGCFCPVKANTAERMLQRFRKTLSSRFQKKSSKDTNSCDLSMLDSGVTVTPSCDITRSLDQAPATGGGDVVVTTQRHVTATATPTTTVLTEGGKDSEQSEQKYRFGPLIWRSSKERKKLNKAARNAKCNSGDSGIQIEMAGGCCDSVGSSSTGCDRLQSASATITSPLHSTSLSIQDQQYQCQQSQQQHCQHHQQSQYQQCQGQQYQQQQDGNNSSESTQHDTDVAEYEYDLEPDDLVGAARVPVHGDLAADESPEFDGGADTGAADTPVRRRDRTSPGNGGRRRPATAPNSTRRPHSDLLLNADHIDKIKADILSTRTPHPSNPRSHPHVRRTRSDLGGQRLLHWGTEVGGYRRQMTSPASVTTNTTVSPVASSSNTSRATSVSPRKVSLKDDSVTSETSGIVNETGAITNTSVESLVGGNHVSLNSDVSVNKSDGYGVNSAANSSSLNKSLGCAGSVKMSAAGVQLRHAAVYRRGQLRRSLSQPLDIDKLSPLMRTRAGAQRLGNVQILSEDEHDSRSHHRLGTSEDEVMSDSESSVTSSSNKSSHHNNRRARPNTSTTRRRVKRPPTRRKQSLDAEPNGGGTKQRLTDEDEYEYEEDDLEDEDEDDVVILAEAVFDHVTIEADELGFKAGDVVEVRRTFDRDWWWGTAKGSTGWFPADRVRLRVSQEDTVEDCLAALAAGNTTTTSIPLRRRTSISLLSNDQVRASVVRELVHTEREFVRVLRDVADGYIAECRKRTDMFNSSQIEAVFGNLEEILKFQGGFLKDLEACVDWEAPHKSCVGACFIKHKKEFTMYSDYCNSHTLATATLQELCEFSNYSRFFEACRLMRGLIEIPLDGYLLTPVQRICKYPLQLAELLKYTRADHEDYEDIGEALSAMRDVAVLINERKRRMESLEKLAAWQQRVEGWEGEDLIDLSSQLIYQGEVMRVTTGMWTSNLMLFLFDYQLVYCKKDILKRNTYIYKGRINLDTTEIIDIPDGKDIHLGVSVRNAIKLYSCIRDKWLLFCCRTPTDKQQWLSAFCEERRHVGEDKVNGLEFLPAARQLARIAARTQKRPPRKPRGDKGYKRDVTYMGSTLQLSGQHSNSLGRKVGTWFTFGGNKKTRHRHRDVS